jgi:hypothetical protein
MSALLNCLGEPDPILIDRGDAFLISAEAWRAHAGLRGDSISPARRRRMEQRERVRWLPLADATRALLREARIEAGLTPHQLTQLLAQPRGFVWDIEAGFHSSIDPDVYGLWLDICQSHGGEVAA